jgi:hypothetical protein
MESTSIYGVRHFEYVSPPTSYGDYLQFKGRALRACASHIKNMPSDKRTVTFHMNLSVVPGKGNTVDEFFYKKLLKEQQKHNEVLNELVHKHAIDRGLYSQATTEEYNFKQNVLNKPMSEMTAATTTTSVVVKQTQKHASLWAKRQIKEMIEQKDLKLAYLRVDKDLMKKRIAFAIQDTLKCLRVGLSKKQLNNVQEYIDRRLTVDSTQKVRSVVTFHMKHIRPVFEIVNGDMNRAGNPKLKEQLGIAPVKTKIRDETWGNVWLIVLLSYLQFIGYTYDEFGWDNSPPLLTNTHLSRVEDSELRDKRKKYTTGFRKLLSPFYVEKLGTEKLDEYLNPLT